MSGAVDPVYVRARQALLDALEALQAHLDAVVLVGAQAIYLHTGDEDLAVAPYTTDGVLALEPGRLLESPLLAEALCRAGFVPTDQPGAWKNPEAVVIDIMVPELSGGPGSRGARLGVHGNRAARKARGLEASLVDRVKMGVGSFLPDDHRSFTIWVAGPGALLVAKLHKISERAANPGRRDDKDALDVLRLLRKIPGNELADAFVGFSANPDSAGVTSSALEILREMFGKQDGTGCEMAVRATEGLEDPDEIRGACTILTRELLAAVKSK
jgi:hypothetical protein